MSKEKQIAEMASFMWAGRSLQKSYPEIAETLYNAGYRKQSDLTPCDCCKFNPPSSTDGKPCTVCPAQAKMKGGGE